MASAVFNLPAVRVQANSVSISAACDSEQTNSWMANSDYDKTTISARLEYHISNRTRLIGNMVYGKYFSILQVR